MEDGTRHVILSSRFRSSCKRKRPKRTNRQTKTGGGKRRDRDSAKVTNGGADGERYDNCTVQIGSGIFY
jgi:hypothetical protein